MQSVVASQLVITPCTHYAITSFVQIGCIGQQYVVLSLSGKADLVVQV